MIRKSYTMPKFIGFQFLIVFISLSSAIAGEMPCSVKDRACITKEVIKAAEGIDNRNWRDQSYREVAKTLAADGDYNQALTIWERIENDDTKAITIRGIGMAAARNKLSGEAYNDLFTVLREKSESIDHPPSYAIALTYIAMAQAFAGDNEGAWATASSMKNDALRHKAYGETAEIQAEVGDIDAAMTSISRIESSAYRNKAYALVSEILSDKENYDGALRSAMEISNAYKKAKALQYVLDSQTRDEAEN